MQCDALAQHLDASQTQKLIDALVGAGWLREVTDRKVREVIDGDKASGMRSFDVALAELGAEALQELGLLLSELDLALGGRLTTNVSQRFASTRT
jgi:hypothetical protein